MNKDNSRGEQYKPFHETYKIVAFTLCVGMIYPNRRTEKLRLIFIGIIFASVTPMWIMMSLDIYKYWIQRDVLNIIRHSTILGPFMGVFFKMLLMNYKRIEAREIINEFNRDFAMYNNFNVDAQKTFTAGIRNSRLYSEISWGITVVTCAISFPLMAIVLNIYNYTIKFNYTRSMVHDMNKPFSEPEDRFESPFYEIVFLHTTYCVLIYTINFIGYDGFFGLSINHACMKMEMIWKLLENATEPGYQYPRLVNVIMEQHRLFRFVDLIKNTYNLWLGAIFIATMIQICTCTYHIVEGYGFDIRYTIFVIGTIIHIYLPCYYAAKLKSMSELTATAIYRSGWENVHDVSIRKMLIFMIARSQNPIEIKAFKIITYDMALFMSIMQTSYSMYTLLRS